MDDLFVSDMNTQNSIETDPFGFPAVNTSTQKNNPFSADLWNDIIAPSDTQQASSNNILDDIFDCNTKTKQDIQYPEFFKSKTKQSTSISPTLIKKSQQQNNNSTNILWDYIDNPNPNNDVSKLFNNVSRPNSKSKATFGTSNFRKQGMLTKEIKKISKISPAAKYLISSYFKHECLMKDDVIIPECVEILAIMYLGHPAFIHVFLGDKNAEPLQSAHKLFIVFGYHTLNNIIHEFFNAPNVKHIVELQNKNNHTKHMPTDSIVNELFNIKADEKERRIWRKDIKMPIPPYNGCYREIFDHIDELFFEEDTVNNNLVQYNDWDEFLEIDQSKRENKLVKNDWVIVVGSIGVLFETKNGVSEIEVLIEQKDVLSDWVRHYQPPDDPWLAMIKTKDINNDKILNLKYYK